MIDHEPVDVGVLQEEHWYVYWEFTWLFESEVPR